MIVFRETFPNATGATAQYSTVGWSRAYTTSTPGVDGTVTTSTNTTTNGGVEGVNTGKGETWPIGCGTAAPYNAVSTVGFLRQSQTSYSSFMFTTKINIPRAGRPLTRLSCYAGNNTSTSKNWLAIRIGTTWYLWNTTGKTTNNSLLTDFSTTAILIQYAVSESLTTGWNELTYTSLRLERSANITALPAGNITGCGFYTERTSSGSSELRFDSFEIELANSLLLSI